MRAATQGGKEGWGGLTRQRVHTACSQGPEGYPPTRKRATLAHIHRREEEG